MQVYVQRKLKLGETIRDMSEIADRVRFPLIVAEGLDVTFYGTVDALERDLKAIDVRNDLYVAYDSAGHRLRLGVTPSNLSMWGL